MHHKNVSILLPDRDAEVSYATGDFFGEYSKPLLCGLQNGVVFVGSLTKLMFHGDPLIRRFNDIIDRVVEGDLFNYWMSMQTHSLQILSRIKQSFNNLLYITASTTKTCNLPSISFSWAVV
jgi:hypothetical protein